MQTLWAVVGARSKLMSKVKFFIFLRISRLNNFLRQRQKLQKTWQVVNKPYLNRRMFGPYWLSIFKEQLSQGEKVAFLFKKVEVDAVSMYNPLNLTWR